MNKTLNSEKLKSLFPYFLLAIGIIIVFRISRPLEGFMLDFAAAIAWLWNVVSPFFYGFVLAYIVNIPIGGIQKLLSKTGIPFLIRRQRMFGVIITLIITLIILALALNFVIPAIISSIVFFVDNIPMYVDAAMSFLSYFEEMNPEVWTIVVTQLTGFFEGFSLEVLAQAVAHPINAIVGAGMAIFSAVIAFISSIYILVEKDKFKRLCRRLLRIFMSRRAGEATIAIFSKLNHNFRQYIRTQTIDGLILGTMATISLHFMGSPFALVLGIMLGVVNYIPYFGSIFGTLIAVLVVTVTQGLTMGAVAAATLLIIQQVDANIVQPRLMSGSFSLSPLLVIISITIGGAAAGIMGMIVAIPIVAILKDIFDSIVEYYEIQKFGKTDKF